MAAEQEALEPRIIHESEGLLIRKNARNQFCVVSLRYTADPLKRSAEWRAEAAAGMSPERFAKEYEIDYTALSGARVFPEMMTRKAQIVVKPPYPEWDESQVYWAGFDYGQRNPTSMHVYTISDGTIYSVWEHYKPAKSFGELAADIKACPYYKQLKYIAADPTIFNNRTNNARGESDSVANCLIEHGIIKFMAGSQNEATWVALMREHWQDEDPSFKIFDCCYNQIREFESAVYVTQTDKALQTQNFREVILDHDNHAIDDCKYFMLSRPKPRQVVSPSGQYKKNPWDKYRI